MSDQTRREFLHNGMTFVAMGIGMPALFMEAAQARTSNVLSAINHPAVGSDKILVLVEFAGGNDGLNTVIPHMDPAYQKLRPRIGIRKSDVVQIDNKLGLHPRLKPLMELYEKGHMSVVTGVGYPNPNYSHFESMDIWQLADPAHQLKERVGWIARYFNEDGHLKTNPLSGLTLSGNMPLAFASEDIAASVYTQGQEDPFTSTNKDREYQARLAARRALYTKGTVANSHLDFIRKVGQHAYTNTAEIRTALANYDRMANKAARYPQYNEFASSMESVAKLILGGLSTRVYYVSVGGFDTHANQPYQHGALLGVIAESIVAFFRDLESQGRDKDVVLMSFSEFGRRAEENDSAGTDHGTASVMFVMGGAVKGGVHGLYPSLTDLKDGDLKFTTDFRRVYANVLDGWLGANSEKVLGGKYEPVGLV
ncbi:MAG: DUF1501 domain-containing protein [Fimbriimonas sp.]|nr:DUF1501 domain-containing protein [Fimbriimonas sp.]